MDFSSSFSSYLFLFNLFPLPLSFSLLQTTSVPSLEFFSPFLLHRVLHWHPLKLTQKMNLHLGGAWRCFTKAKVVHPSTIMFITSSTNTITKRFTHVYATNKEKHGRRNTILQSKQTQRHTHDEIRGIDLPLAPMSFFKN